MKRLQVSVEEYTTPNPVVATENATVDELVQLMKRHGIRHLPIVRDQRVVGMISERDIKVVTSLPLQEKAQVRAADFMAREPATVDSTTSLDEVAFEMSKRKIGSVLVNEQDKFLGIFTVTDALNALIEIIRDDRNV